LAALTDRHVFSLIAIEQFDHIALAKSGNPSLPAVCQAAGESGLPHRKAGEWAPKIPLHHLAHEIKQL